MEMSGEGGSSDTLPTEKVSEELPDPLPAAKLCNKNPPFNPVQGEGALGNRFAGKMHYAGSDKEELVKTLQKMLNELGIRDDDGNPLEVDGDFGSKTEGAVKKFQEENKDWDGEQLSTDGLVGPKTSDALNRAMVGRWYKVYQTDKSLTDDKPIITVTSERLADGIPMSLEGAEAESEAEETTRRRRDDGRSAFENVPPPIQPSSFKIEILDSAFNDFEEPIKFNVEERETTTNEEGFLMLHKKRSQIELVGKSPEASSTSDGQ